MPNLEINPPVYPLSRAAFKHALTTGHGRALIHAENFDIVDYRDEILEAATRCLVYDTQIDGYREWWLSRLCKAAGLIGMIIDLPPTGSANDRAQRAGLLKEFCLAGHVTALSRLYAMCSFDNPTHEVSGCNELIEVDGEQGLIFVARRLGEMLIQDPDYWTSDWELNYFDDLYGAGRAKVVLSEAAHGEPSIQAYLQKMITFEERDGDKSEQSTGPEIPEPVESVIHTIKTATKRVGWLRGWGNKASPEDREEVAKLLKTESRVTVLINALWCFSRKGLPAYDGALLGLIFHEDDNVRFYAAQTFSHHVESEVRLAGLALLNRGDLELGTELLRLNAISEDCELIVAILSANQTGDDNHGVLSNLIQMLEENETVREPLIPLYVYEFSPCMVCRERAVEILIRWGACPQWIIEEAAQDASEDIRALSKSFTSEE